VVYRITLFLFEERGPFRCADAFRELAKRYGCGRVVECFHCLSVWVALPISLLGENWLMFTLAASGGACILHSAVEYWRSSSDALGGHE